MKIYGIWDNWKNEYELEEVEVRETAKLYVAADSIRSYGWRRTIQKDDSRLAFTKQEAWAKAIARAEEHVNRLKEAVAAAEVKLEKLRLAATI